MAQSCSSCGAEAKEAAKFCTSCGNELVAAKSGLIREKRARITAEEKKRAVMPWMIGGAIVAAALVIVVFMARGGFAGRGKASAGPDAHPVYEPLLAKDGAVRVPFSVMTDGKAHFFSYNTGAGTIRFFALAKPDGSIGVALDACNACYRAKQGYRDAGGQVICNNCNMAFRSADIGVVTGGCNPIPLEHAAQDGMLVVRTADLEKNARFF